MDFRDAMKVVTGELTPQPQDWTDPAGATLTVIPAGLREAPGDAEVIVRITASKTLAAEVGIRTADMPGLLAALDAGTAWSHETTLNDEITVTPAETGGIVLTVTEFDWTTAGRGNTIAAIHLPTDQRKPLESALARATDIARGWED